MACNSWKPMFPPLATAERAKVKEKRERILNQHGQWVRPSKTNYHLNLYNALMDGREHNMMKDLVSESCFGPAHELQRKLKMMFRLGDSLGNRKGRFLIECRGDLVRR